MIILKKYLSRFQGFGYAHQPGFGHAHQPSSSIFRYLGLTSILIIGSQVLFGTGQVYSNYRQKLNNLETRVEDTANFFGEVKKESQIPINDRILARLLTQASLKEDLLYAVVLDDQGVPTGSFLNESTPLMGQVLQDESQNLDVLTLISTLKEQKNIREIRRPILIDNDKVGQVRIGYSVSKIHQDAFKSAENTLIVSACLSGFLIAALNLLFYREIRKPLQDLVIKARKLSHQSPEYAGHFLQEDELQQLTQLLQHLQDNLQEIEQKQTLSQKAELTQEYSQIEPENLAKSRFLAMIGHELRTPLNGVTGMTGLLLDTKLSSQQREFVNIIRNSGETLLTMINNILDFAKIEANKLELEETPFELGECIEEALRLFVSQASEKKLELAYLIEPHTPNAIVGDVNRLRQIIVNLLGNAVKFTETGEVVVYVNATPISEPAPENGQAPEYEIRFAVKDTGIGIPSSRMDRLFKSFSQVDASTSRKYGGTGLGLAISKQLTEMMGGKMWVHSVEGKGSTFYFTILAKAAPSLSPANSPTAEEILGGKRMLIVDDVVTNQKILTHQANSWGMLTCTVESALKALEWLKQGWTFDVVILDMNMPEIDGLTLAQEIRQLPQCKRLPLVMLSSLGKPDMNGISEEIDFAAILTKPIQQSQLYEVLVRALREQPIVVNQNKEIDSPRLADSLPLRILVAEDMTVNQEVIRLQLEKLGYLPDLVSNGVEVLEALRRQPYDVILMDIRMPEMNGTTATYHIQQEWTVETRPKIIAMTADAMQGDREKCIEAGMDDYIAKPVRLEDLRRALSKCGSTSLTNRRPLEDQNPPIDRKVLDSIQQIAGHRAPQVKADLINNYLEDTPSRIEAIAKAIRENHLDNLRYASHALRSSSLQMGANQLAHLAQELENSAGRSGTILGASEKFTAIEIEYQRVYQALISELGGSTTLTNPQLPLKKVNPDCNGSLITVNDNN